MSEFKDVGQDFNPETSQSPEKQHANLAIQEIQNGNYDAAIAHIHKAMQEQASHDSNTQSTTTENQGYESPSIETQGTRKKVKVSVDWTEDERAQVVELIKEDLSAMKDQEQKWLKMTHPSSLGVPPSIKEGITMLENLSLWVTNYPIRWLQDNREYLSKYIED